MVRGWRDAGRGKRGNGLHACTLVVGVVGVVGVLGILGCMANEVAVCSGGW